MKMDIINKLKAHKEEMIKNALKTVPGFIHEKEEESVEPDKFNVILQKVWARGRKQVNNLIGTLTDEEVEYLVREDKSLKNKKRNKKIKKIKNMEEIKQFKREIQKNIKKEDVLQEIKKAIEKKEVKRKRNEGIPGKDEWFLLYFKKNANQYTEIMETEIVKNVVRLFLTIKENEKKKLNYKDFMTINHFMTSDNSEIEKGKEFVFSKTMQAVARKGYKDIVKELGEEKFNEITGKDTTYYTHTKKFIYQESIISIYDDLFKKAEEYSFPDVFMKEIEKDKELKKKWHKQRVRGLF